MYYDVWHLGHYVMTIKASTSQEAKMLVSYKIGYYYDYLNAFPNNVETVQERDPVYA